MGVVTTEGYVILMNEWGRVCCDNRGISILINGVRGGGPSITTEVFNLINELGGGCVVSFDNRRLSSNY